jgi:EEF1A lysine methyltransferase 2
MVEWCLEYIPPDSPSRVLEVGSGNGTLLFALLESGYLPHTLCGIDYSEDAIKLSRAIAANKGSEATEITFAICDFLCQDPPEKPDSWDLILDKGTYDAMSLGEKDNSGHAPNFRYPERVARLLKPGGCFLITCTQYMSLLDLFPKRFVAQHVTLLKMSSKLHLSRLKLDYYIS